MGIENLRQELRLKTDKEVQRIETEAKEEAKRIKSQAKDKGDEFLELAKKEAMQAIEKEKMRIPAARLKAKRMLQDARYELVSEALVELKRMMKKRTGSKREYGKILEKLIKEGQREVGGNAVIAVRKEDAQFAKKFGKVANASTMGGAIIKSADGRVSINNTFEALLEKNREALEQKAFELLFVKKGRE